jgi:hypothetical protein
MSEVEKKEKGFEVKDRRRFTEGGEPRKEEKLTEAAAPAPDSSGKEEAKPPVQEKAPVDPPGEKQEPSQEFPEINFSTFVFSLSSSVLIHLGMAPDPVTGEQKKELGVAKQTIDILGMIQEKTKGNLSKEEKQLMDGILYDLRLRYVEEAKKQ